MDDKKSGLVYYTAKEWNELFVYGGFYDFFRKYDKKTDSWRASEVPYSRFLHDFCVAEVDEERVRSITGGNLPVEEYAEYRHLLGEGKEDGR